MHDIDHSSYELGAIQLKLRRDLSFRRQSFGDEPCYVIEDATASRFYRVGVSEYTFLSLLDGNTSIADAVAHCATQLGADSITETQAAALCSWLIQNSLASTTQSRSSTRLIEKSEAADSRRMREWLNPISLKLPLGSPDRLVRAIAPWTSWVFGSLGFVIWMLACAIGGYNVFANWDKLTSGGQLLSADNWLWLGITCLALKLLHEVAHSVACRRFGGETREAGLLLLLFIPLPYVDVTSAWRFGSKWHRIIVSAAGMYVEAFVAALAAIVWTHTTSEIVQHHAINVLATAGFVTILFNMNPLMRFDGYYILSDLFDLPNLGTHGQQDLHYLARRWLLDIKTNRPQWPEGRGAVVRLYGIAAFAWRILICVSLTLAAEMLFHGAGIVLAVAAVVLWVVVPTFKFARYLVVGDPINPPNRLRFLTIAAGLLIVGFGIWNYVPYIERLQLAAVVECDQIVTVRTAAPGFVREISVKSGETVREGQFLARLENPQLESQIAELELTIKQSQIDSTRFHRKGQMSAFQVEQENESALQNRLLELERQANELILTAPSDGTILSRNLDDMQNQWLTSGSEFCLLGDESERVIHVVIPQSDIDLVRRNANEPVNVHVWGQPSEFTGTIRDIESRGSTILRHPSLAANVGGPLAIQPTKGPSSDESQWQLLEPHFIAYIHARPESLRLIGNGQTAIVELTTDRGTIGQVLIANARQFLSQRQLTEH
jgi:putative peptide zinc metalloprotease protein